MSIPPKRLFVFTGEASGDLHGAALVEKIRQLNHDMSIEGVGGPLMRSQHIAGPLAMEDFEVMGFTDVLKALPRLWKNFNIVRDTIMAKQPDAVLLIDYPGFNLKLAKALRQRGYQGKVIQYVSPSVWAWGPHRVDDMAKTLDLLMTIYPFEASYFAQTPLKVKYVGLPLNEEIGNHSYDEHWKDALNIPMTSPLVALFPGSREAEIERNLPLMLETASMFFNHRQEALFGISCNHEKNRPLIESIVQKYAALKKNLWIVPRQYTYELMRSARCAIAKSGTVTLELALHHCPTVVIYKLKMLDKWYAQYVVKVNLPHYCIVNILTKQDTFPEYIKEGVTADRILASLNRFYDETPERKACMEECRQLELSIGACQASRNAAQAILRTLS